MLELRQKPGAWCFICFQVDVSTQKNLRALDGGVGELSNSLNASKMRGLGGSNFSLTLLESKQLSRALAEF